MNDELDMNLIHEKMDMIDVSQVEARVMVTLGPGWPEGITLPQYLCCFYLTFWTPEGKPVAGPWISLN
jgi:hypothetical protein